MQATKIAVPPQGTANARRAGNAGGHAPLWSQETTPHPPCHTAKKDRKKARNHASAPIPGNRNHIREKFRGAGDSFRSPPAFLISLY